MVLVHTDGPSRRGRPRIATKAKLSAVALHLFHTQGFTDTSVEDIARAAGLSRSTFFNYFSSKSDAIWSCHAAQLDEVEERLQTSGVHEDPFETVARALIEVTSDVAPEESVAVADFQGMLAGSVRLRETANEWSLRRTRLISVFMASRLGLDEDDLVPRAYALALGGAISAASAVFARSADRGLSEVMTESIMPVFRGYAADWSR